MRYEIRAMSFGEIIDMGFQLLRNHFALLLSLSLVLYTPIAAFNLAVASLDASGPGDEPQVLLIVGIVALLMLSLVLIAPIVGAAATFAVGRLYLGEDVTFGRALRAAFAVIAPLLGTALLAWLMIGLAVGAMVVGATILVTLATTEGGGAGFFIVRALLILIAVAMVVLPTTFLYLALLLLWQVMIFERVFGTRAIRRSLTLMEGEKLRAFGVLLVVGLLVGILSGGLQLVLGVFPYLGAIGVPMAQAVGHAYTNAVWVILYFDIRCRKEAFDLEHLARLVQAQTAAPIPAPALPR